MVLFSIERLSAQAFSNSKFHLKKYLERLNIPHQGKSLFSEPIFLFESWRSHTRGGKDTSPSPHVTSRVTTALIVKSQHYRSQGNLYNSQRHLHGCQTPRKVNTASHRPLGKGLVLFGARFCRGQGTTAPTSTRQPPKCWEDPARVSPTRS